MDLFNISLLKNKFFILPAILVLTVIIYFPTFHNGFIANWDDGQYVTNNPHIKILSWENIKNIFGSQSFSYYFPLTTFTFAIDYHFWGINPLPYHIVNLALHLLNIILVFYLIEEFTGNIFVSAFTAMMFGIHPMHVESVAWIAERKDVLYSCFYLSSLILFMKHLKKNNLWYLFFSFILFGLSLLAKPSALTFPFILLIVIVFIKKEINLSLFKKILPFLIVTILIGCAALFLQIIKQHSIHISLFDLVNGFFISFYSLLFYLVKFFVPGNLSVIHYFPMKNSGYLPLVYYLSPVIIVFLVWTILKIKLFKKEILFGLLFFFLHIIIYLKIIPFGTSMVAERNTYLAYIGLFFIAGLFFNRWLHQFKFKSILIIILVLYITGIGLITFNRVKIWRNGIILFTDVINKYPDQYKSYDIRGNAKVESKDYAGAMNDFDQSIKLYPYYAKAYKCRGDLKLKLKDSLGAINDYSLAVKTNPDYFEAYDYRAYVKHCRRDYSGAINDYDKAILLHPKDANLFLSRAYANESLGNIQKACDDLKNAKILGCQKTDELIKLFCK